MRKEYGDDFETSRDVQVAAKYKERVEQMFDEVMVDCRRVAFLYDDLGTAANRMLGR